MKIGVCGSDIHVYHPGAPLHRTPITQGHEVSSGIAALGEGHRVHCGPEGDHSAPRWCAAGYWPCHIQQAIPMCEGEGDGLQTTGVASLLRGGRQRVACRRMSFDGSAMIEPTGSGGPRGARPGREQGYLRAGGGHRHLVWAARAWGRKVMVTDVSDIRLEKAECSADVCVGTWGFARRLIGPDKADVITDCAGITSPWARPLPTPARAQHHHPGGRVSPPGDRPGGAQRPASWT